MKLAIISSNHLRHNFFINSLIKNFNVIGIAQEVKKRDYSKKGEGTDLENEVKQYFNDREASEHEFFEENRDLESGNYNLVQVPAGETNDAKYVEMIKSWGADYLAVFGSSLLKESIVNLFKLNHIVNMHLGLSPYYRGSGTNFWPLYDEKLQYVGVTIHYLDLGIDSGDIIIQGRPKIEKGDTPHSIGNKTIVLGVELMIEVFKKINQGEEIRGHKQDHNKGKLCLFKHCKPEHILKVVEEFNSGLVEKYLSKKNRKVEIIDKL